jgi:hypothetical protein
MFTDARSELTAVILMSIILDVTPCSLEIASCFIGLLFDLEDGGSTSLRNVGKLFTRLRGTTCEKITLSDILSALLRGSEHRVHIVRL